MVGPKKQDCWPRIKILKGFFFNLSMNVSLSKIGHDFSNKVVQKLTEEKNVCNKKWSPKLIFFNDFFFNSVDFWHQKLTLKVRFWHFLTNCHSLTEFFNFFSFEYVDSWPKILLFRTHHLWNYTTELILINTNKRNPKDCETFLCKIMH